MKILLILLLISLAALYACSPDRPQNRQYPNDMDTIDSPPDTSNIVPPDTLAGT